MRFIIKILKDGSRRSPEYSARLTIRPPAKRGRARPRRSRLAELYGPSLYSVRSTTPSPDLSALVPSAASTGPGATALTLICRGPSSAASDRVMWWYQSYANSSPLGAAVAGVGTAQAMTIRHSANAGEGQAASRRPPVSSRPILPTIGTNEWQLSGNRNSLGNDRDVGGCSRAARLNGLSIACLSP